MFRFDLFYYCFYCCCLPSLWRCLTGTTFILFLLLLLVTSLATKDAEHATASLVFALAALYAGYGGDGLRFAFARAFGRDTGKADGVGLQRDRAIALEATVAPTCAEMIRERKVSILWVRDVDRAGESWCQSACSVTQKERKSNKYGDLRRTEVWNTLSDR